MNPRVLTPYKILAVAALSAGCVSSPRAEPPAASASVPPPAPPETPAASAPAPSAPAPASGDAADPSGPSDPRGDAARSLDALRDELEADGDALTRIAHYRPLCDARGYPLVGNVIRKGPSPRVQPSALCASVRSRSARR